MPGMIRTEITVSPLSEAMLPCPPKAGPRSVRRYRRIAAAVSGCLFGLLVACGGEPGDGERRVRGNPLPSTRTQAFRPGQGRLVGVSWADARPADGLESQAKRLRSNAAEVFETPGERESLGPLRADAVLFLLAGDMERAVGRFARISELAPANPIAWSDLAAARLHRGAAASDPYDFFLALAAANRAVRLDSKLLAGQFNRALALQRVSLLERAREEWRLYRPAERDPQWSRAADIHAAAVKRNLRHPASEDHLRNFELAVERGDRKAVEAIVAGSPQLLREHGEGVLLMAWADAEARRDEPEALRLLGRLRLLGDVLAARGEHMVADTVSRIDEMRVGQSVDRTRLIAAFQGYGRGISLARNGDPAGCLSSMEAARKGLDDLRVPLAEWATYWIANCRYQRSEYASSLDLLRSLAAERYRERYPALHGRSQSLVGLIQTIQGDPAASMTAYDAAVVSFRRVGESANASRMASLLAASLDALGRPVEAWRRLYPALIDPAAQGTPVARELIVLTAAWLANGEGEREIALWFHEEVVRNARATGEPPRIIEALRGHGEILAVLGDREAAAKNLDLAKEYLAKIPDPVAHEVLAGDLWMAEAKLSDSPEEAAVLLDDVVRIYRSSQYHYRLAQAYFARAQAREALGRSEEAEQDLVAAFTEFELQRERIDSLEERILYFDRTREILDAMIRLQLERRPDSADAFAYSERAKARVLLDWVLAQPGGDGIPEQAEKMEPAAIDPASLQRRLPADTTVVQYWALPEKLVIWVLRRDDFQVTTVDVRSQALETLVQRLTRELAGGQRPAFLQTSSSLYEILIRPIERHIPPRERIVVVPDGALHGLPFVLLWNGRTEKYLIQEHICSVAPSTRILLASLRRDRELAAPGEPKILVVSDPAFDQKLFPLLGRLRESEKEAEFATVFPGSDILSDLAATKQAFLDQAGDFEIVHFGGHSLVNQEYPLLSQMLFAGDPNDQAHGVLYSGEILGRRFERTRLAVLASCSTAAGRISRTEGVESLARPFLAAGVPAVVASLWDVDDKATADFFSRFYRHLSRDFDPAQALQRAQKDSIADDSDPRAWGAFELIGGNTSRR